MALNKEIHESVMIQVLTELFMNPEIGHLIGFKGGTSVFLFHNLPRFSVGLDFDILDISKTEFIFEKVKNILEKFGEIKHADHKIYGLFFALSYKNKPVSGENLKLDFSIKQFGSKYEKKEYMGVSMLVMVREDIMAHKMCAMYERGLTTTRDIYDVWFFLNNFWPVNKDIIKLRTGLDYLSFLNKLIEILNKQAGENMLESLGELLESEQDKIWVKNKLHGQALLLLKIAVKVENS